MISGSDRQRAGDAETLALAAGEFVRIAVERTGIEADHPQQITRALHRDLGIGAAGDRAIGDDLADPAARIERGERVLEDHLDAVALRAQRLAFECREIDIADAHGAAVGLDQPHHQTRH